MRELKNFINGEYVASKSGETSQVINPANGEAYATAPVSSAADVDAAYQAAQKGFEEAANLVFDDDKPSAEANKKRESSNNE